MSTHVKMTNCWKSHALAHIVFKQHQTVLDTGARIYENLLPCLMLRGLLFNSVQNFEKIIANKKMENLAKVIRSDIFFKSLKSHYKACIPLP